MAVVVRIIERERQTIKRCQAKPMRPAMRRIVHSFSLSKRIFTVSDELGSFFLILTNIINNLA